MSVILDALKRADQDRTLAHVPTLDSVHMEADAPPRRILPWVVVGALLAGGVAGYWALASVWSSGEKLAPPGGSHAERQSGPDGRTQSSKQPPSSERAEEQAIRRPTVAAQSARPDGPSAGKGLALAKSSPASIPAEPRRSTSATKSAASAQAPAPDPAKADIEAEAQEILSLPAAKAAVSPALAAPPTAAAPSTPKSDPAPSFLREAVGKMTLNGVVYSEQPADRKVYIGGRGYGEGDIIDRTIRIEEIRPDGATLAYHEERALLRMAGKRN